jgi:hypothetical protein
MTITVKKNFQISKSIKSIDVTPLRNETFDNVEVKHNNSTYYSYGVYTSLNDDQPEISFFYLLLDGKMTPRVVKAAPSGHIEGHLYAFTFDGYAYEAEKHFELLNIPHIKFSAIKYTKEVFAPGLVN